MKKKSNGRFMEWNLVCLLCIFLLELLSPGNGQSIAWPPTFRGWGSFSAPIPRLRPDRNEALIVCRLL